MQSRGKTKIVKLIATPNNLKTPMVKVYKIDKVACLKHMVAEDGLSLSYRSKTEECRRMEALQKRKQRTVRFTSDANAEYGPPDRQCNFQEKIRTGQKRKATTECTDNIPKKAALSLQVNYTPNPHPEVLGKHVRMKFESTKGKNEWYEGIIVS